MAIPSRVHFCWIGESLPWVYVFGVLSAAAQGGMEEVVLHHTDPLREGPELRALHDAPGVRLARLDPAEILARAEAQAGIGAGSLQALYRGLDTPVLRSDLLRSAILYIEGGVYLDLDTVTVRPFAGLLEAEGFIGTEHVVWPPGVRDSRSPLVWGRHLSLDLLRKALRAAPGGWRIFARLRGLFPAGLNGAVLGAQEGAPFLRTALKEMAALALPLDDPYAIGPHLFARLLGGPEGEGVLLLPPEYFYPVAPEISAHLFRNTPHARAGDILFPQTRVVHWYASVRTRERARAITPEFVRAHRGDQLYSALVAGAIAL